jgi:hypothetical protein
VQGEFENAIDYLNKIMNWKVDLAHRPAMLFTPTTSHRTLRAGKFDLLEYLAKSVYRFMVEDGEPEHGGRRNFPISTKIATHVKQHAGDRI